MSTETVSHDQLLEEVRALRRRCAELESAAASGSDWRQGEHKYRSLYNSMNEMMVIHELICDEAGRPTDYRILDCNPAFERCTGIQRVQAVGEAASRLYGTGQAPFLEIYAQVVLTGEPARFEAYFEPMQKHFRISAVSLGGNQFATVASDVTESREMERERESLGEQLRQVQKMQAIGQLAGGVAHNFNNLLLAMSCHIEGIADTMSRHNCVRTGTSCVQPLTQLRQAIEMGSSLTRQLLDFCRKRKLNPSLLDPNQIVTRVAGLLKDIIGKHIRIEVVTEPDVGGIYADPGQIEQALVNLALNARDAMPNGGKLTIRTSRVASAPITASSPGAAQLTGPFVEISVTDTGVGMDEQTRQRLFEPFFTTKPLGQGTGLGLATVYGIIEQTDGLIHVESRPGLGTSFRLFLPMIQTPVDGAAPQDANGGNGGQTILVCDDEPMVRQLIAGYLASCGYAVLDAGSGEEALQVATAHSGSIELLLTDLMLPGIHGLDLAARIRQTHPHMHVLLITGYPPEVVESLGGLRPDYVLQRKPFQLGDLLRILQHCLTPAAR